MMRIVSACIEQTNQFESREDYDQYRRTLDRKRKRYCILDTQEGPDGSLIVKVKRQFNHYSTGEYLPE